MKIAKANERRYHYATTTGQVLSVHGGHGDSLGRTATAAHIYNEDREFLIRGVKQYFSNPEQTSPETGKHIYVTRFPDIWNPWFYARGNSRDHVVNATSYLVRLGEHDFVKNFLKHKAKRPCIDHAYTIDQKVLFKAYYSHFWSWVYLLIELPWILATAGLNWFLRLISGTLKSYQTPEQFLKAFPERTAFRYCSKWQKAIFKLIVPTYSFHYTLNGINAIQNKTAKRILRVVIRTHFERHNYVGRFMTGDFRIVPEKWVPTGKNRWSIRLDKHYNRDCMLRPDDTESDNLELAEFNYYKRLNQHAKKYFHEF